MAKHAKVYYINSEGLSFKRGCYIRHVRKNKIDIFDIVNSPLFDYTQTDPALHIDCPEVENHILKIISKIKPDIIHIHELIFPASLISKVSVPMITTLHNYSHICTQFNLMHKGVENCYDYENGAKCVECSSPLMAKNRNYFLQLKIRYTLNCLRAQSLINAFNLIRPLFARKAYVTTEAKLKYYEDYGHEKFPAESYVERRRAMIDVLKHMSFVHCASEHLVKYMISCGLDNKQLRLIPLSSATLNEIKPKPLRGNELPVTFGYFGGFNINKGIETLLPAFKRLDSRKARLILFGHGIGRLRVDAPNITVIPNPESTALSEVLSSVDVGIVPSVWQETFGIIGLELNNARIPVIGSKFAGIPQWLSEGVNGVFVEPGNVDDLASKMQAFIDDPTLIADFQIKMRPWKTMEQHAAEIYQLYTEALTSQRRPASAITSL